MWDSLSLRTMNERADAQAVVVHKEVRYDIGWHSVVDVKIYGDGHEVLTCRSNLCRALTEEELKSKPCGNRARGTGW